MASLQLVDLVETTLSAGYTAGGTSLSLTSTAGLPASGDYWLSVYDPANSVSTYEVFKVTGAPSAGAVPVVGAQSTTTAKNHSAGHIAYGSVITAAALAQLKLDAQTPWASDIDGASHKLSNVSLIGIGAPAVSQIGVLVQGAAPAIVDGFTQVQTNAASGAGLLLQNNSGKTASLRIYGSTSAFGANLTRLSTDLDLAVFTASTERVRITAAGAVGIGTPAARSQLSIIPAVTPTTLAAANQVTIGESSNASGYQLQIGYASVGGTYESAIQALAGGAGSALIVNAAGGVMIVNAPQSSAWDAVMPNSSYYLYLYEPGNQVAIRVKTSGGVIKQAVFTLS